MEGNDRARILSLLDSNMDLRRLYEEHLSYEGRLAEFANRPFLTEYEEIEEKKLKIKKLQGVDKMMRILSAGDVAQMSA